MVSIGPKGRYFVISIQQVCDVLTRRDDVRSQRKIGSSRSSTKVTRLTHFRRAHSRTWAHNCAI